MKIHNLLDYMQIFESMTASEYAAYTLASTPIPNASATRKA